MPRTQSRQQGWRFAGSLAVFVLYLVALLATRCAGSDTVELDPHKIPGASSAALPANIWRTVAGAGGVALFVALLLLWRARRTAVKAVDRMVGCIGKGAPTLYDLKADVKESGMLITPRGTLTQDAPGRLIHRRVKRNDG